MGLFVFDFEFFFVMIFEVINLYDKLGVKGKDKVFGRKKILFWNLLNMYVCLRFMFI